MEDIIYMVSLVWEKNGNKKFTSCACKTLEDAKEQGNNYAQIVEEKMEGEIVLITIEKQEYVPKLRQYFAEKIDEYFSYDTETKEWRARK